MTRRFRLSRRTVLRGVGSIAVGLPWLEAMALDPLPALGSAAVAQTMGGGPKRMVVMFTGNGTIYRSWTCQGDNTSLSLSPILSPLEPHKSEVLVVEGCDMTTTENDDQQIGQHSKGTLHAMTAMKAVNEQAGGPSYDHALKNILNPPTYLKTWELGVCVQGAKAESSMSWSAKQVRAPPECDPYRAFDRIFANLNVGGGTGGSTPDPGAVLLNKKKTLVLDAILADYKSLSAKVGYEDKQRLEAHISYLEEIAQQLDTGGEGPAPGGSCAKPNMGTRIDPRSNNNAPQIGKLMADLITMAFACDRVRIVTLMLAPGGEEYVTFPFLGISGGFHVDISHNAGARENDLVRINTFFAQQFAYLVGRLKSIQEGSGTLLDHTLAVWQNELQNGGHNRSDVPFVLAGKCGGAVRPGRVLRVNTAHNNLITGMMNAMGAQVQSFGWDGTGGKQGQFNNRSPVNLG